MMGVRSGMTQSLLGELRQPVVTSMVLALLPCQARSEMGDFSPLLEAGVQPSILGDSPISTKCPLGGLGYPSRYTQPSFISRGELMAGSSRVKGFFGQSVLLGTLGGGPLMSWHTPQLNGLQWGKICCHLAPRLSSRTLEVSPCLQAWWLDEALRMSALRPPHPGSTPPWPPGAAWSLSAKSHMKRMSGKGGI